MVDIFAGSPREGSFLILAAPSLIQFEVSGSGVFLNFGAEHGNTLKRYKHTDVYSAVSTNLIFEGTYGFGIVLSSKTGGERQTACSVRGIFYV